MEQPNGERHMIAVLVVEFASTILFTLAFCIKAADIWMSIILCSYILIFAGVSGGHMNPCVTIGVYIERQKYGRYFCYMVLIIVAQMLGAFVAVMVAFLMRVSLPDPDNPGGYYFVPDFQPFFPPLQQEAEGMPAWGQVLLGETLATMTFILVVLYVKDHIEKNPQNEIVATFAVPVSLVAMISAYGQISGAVMNPCLLTASVVWLNLAAGYERGVQWSGWSGEYVAVYLFAEILGAFIAGHIHNQLKRMEKRMRQDVLVDSDSETETEYDKTAPRFATDAQRNPSMGPSVRGTFNPPYTQEHEEEDRLNPGAQPVADDNKGMVFEPTSPRKDEMGSRTPPGANASRDRSRGDNVSPNLSANKINNVSPSPDAGFR